MTQETPKIDFKHFFFGGGVGGVDGGGGGCWLAVRVSGGVWW